LILAGSLRVQLMPAIAVIGLWTVLTIFRRQRLTFLGSGLLIGLLYGAIDGLTWSYPFEALWRNIVANLYYGVAADFGILPWYWYPATMLKYWTGLAPLMVALCLTGARRLPQLFAAAALIAATYSLIGHKELRFIYPAILLAIIVSGIGLAQFVSWISEVLHHGGWPWRSAVIAPSAMTVAVVVLTQLALASGSKPYRGLWTTGDMFLASRYVARLNSVCGIGILGNDFVLSKTGGYASFHHAVSLYWGSLDPESKAFNTIVYDRGTAIGRSYMETACFGDSCVAQRPGTCSPVPMKELRRLQVCPNLGNPRSRADSPEEPHGEAAWNLA
jgi:GPI mannosyltransferase 3